MPHKHKRRRGEDDAANFDLPPDARARALPAYKPKAVVADDDDDSQPKRSNKRRKPNKPKTEGQENVLDDTPKQFARLLAFQRGKKLRKGLDDGMPQPKPKDKKREPKDKSRKMTTTTTKISEKAAVDEAEPSEAQNESSADAQAQAQLKIQPGERLGDFGLRVDQSLPLSAVPKHGTRAPQVVPGVKEKTYLTKHNKRLARVQAQWREDEARLKERREEAAEEVDDQREEEGLLWMDVDEARKGRKGKKASREGDIWRVLERKRRDEGTFGADGGLTAGTAVQAPPVLKRVKNMFKERAGQGRRSVAA